MAGPVRFRYSSQGWSAEDVHDRLVQPLAGSLGATADGPWFVPPDGYEATRLAMADGSMALFCYGEADAYWLGNTETPEALWETNKLTFAEAPDPVTEWAERELLAQLELEEPWLAAYDTLSWFFLPVLFSKDGRESTRGFFRDHAAGFPEADRDDALAFYDDFLATGVLDPYRYTMASKLGTSAGVDLARMQATMGEFDAAKLLADAGHDFEPEVEFASGHALDFQVGEFIVEVTRPVPPARRRANSPVRAVAESGRSKSDDQIAIHGNAVLVVDCTSFDAADWEEIADERPAMGHEPAIVFRMRPDGRTAGYVIGPDQLGFGAVLD